MKKSLLISLCLLSSLMAEEKKQSATLTQDKLSRVYVGGYGGYGTINGAYSNDGEYAQYRFTLGVDAYCCHKWAFGFEGGVQSGNSMPVDAKTTLITAAGGLQPQAVLKPMLDLLAYVRWNFTGKWSLLLKGGVAYRQMQWTDRTSSKDYLRNFNGEFQGGFGYQLTKHARLVGLYQGIYSNSSVGCKLDGQGNVTMHHIPTQQAGLFGVEYHF